MENIKTRKHILLTGAGFTKNFGGFLADEMWSKLFNKVEIQNNSDIRNKLSDNYDYETVYQEILHDSKTEYETINTLNKVLSDIYKMQDESYRRYIYDGSREKADINHMLPKFIHQFSEVLNEKGKLSERGFFFTTNQDLFIERYIFERSTPLSEGEYGVTI